MESLHSYALENTLSRAETFFTQPRGLDTSAKYPPSKKRIHEKIQQTLSPDGKLSRSC